ncbi:hypothetical protein [Glycomyces buryatensis]|uniref:DUF624 domain-containing protein n=1 Tax=Glycomyces buryatensis TaxID=2570927 RepID=A0A4S8PQT4_9ACTN|nr:hypothetical protein [Glycomyces buryatensis]THV33488.1 hypothetical protein FAB82_25445 [Glycomyces buryatensis]
MRRRKVRSRGRRTPGQWSTQFALFAECLLTGVWFTVAALPIVTVPAALAASARHLSAFVDGTPSSLGDFVGDLRTAVREGWRAGAAVIGCAALLALDLAVLAQEGVPGRSQMALLTLMVTALAATVLLRAAAAWEPGENWRGLFAVAVDDTRRDLSGTGILLGGLAVLLACMWALPILFMPMSGCVVGAAVAVRRRRLHRTEG